MVFENLTAALPGWELVIFILLFFFFLLSGGVTTIILLSRLRWNYKVTIAETAGKESSLSGGDRARLVKVGDGGEELFFLKKRKIYRGAYGKRIGKRHIMWVINNEDGLWYNVTFGDLNKKLMEVGVVPTDRDARMAMAASRKLIDSRYDKKSWMDKYGTILYFGLFTLTLLIFGGVMWFAFDKQLEIAHANAAAIEASKEVMTAAKQVLGIVDNIQSGGSGLVPAT